MYAVRRAVWGAGLPVVAGVLGVSALAPHSRLDAKRKDVVLAGVEAGGTTWRVGVAVNHATNIVEQAEFETTTPRETLAKVQAWLQARQVDAVGIASFGPVDLAQGSSTYGHITTTPKPGWAFTDVVGPIRASLPPSTPLAFDTDVNAPAMAEFQLHNTAYPSTPLSSCAYVTVGTGIGVGLVINGQCVHGLMHPEGGHISVPMHPHDEHLVAAGKLPVNDPKAIPFGGLGVEGMTNSEAIAVRAGVPRSQLKTLPDSHPAWDCTAHYLAALCVNLVLVASPERIVLSGGVMTRASLFPKIRTKFREMMRGYVNVPQLTEQGLEQYIVPSPHGNDIGLIGALALAQDAYDTAQQQQ